ncbi:MAG: inorganic phosphate transporter [Thermoanaerobaculia bacterium]
MALAGGLVDTFSGAGLVPDATAESERFLTAVGVGAGLTVLLASVLGLPISTTHSLVGALLGAGLAAVPGAVDLSVLGSAFLLPLALGPLLAAALAGTLYPLARAGRRALGVRREACVCVGSEWVPVRPIADGAPTGATGLPLVASGQRLSLATGTTDSCQERYRGTALGVSVQHGIDATHFLSAGAVGFARGLNDTPKIAALLIGAGAVGANVSMWAIGVAIAIGGLLGARRVAETMSHRITSLTRGQGLVSNLSAAVLVTVASRYGLPVSTTHVTNGGLFAIGAETGGAHWDTIGKILIGDAEDAKRMKAFWHERLTALKPQLEVSGRGRRRRPRATRSSHARGLRAPLCGGGSGQLRLVSVPAPRCRQADLRPRQRGRRPSLLGSAPGR